MKDTQKLGNTLKRLRMNNRLTLRELSQLSGVSFSFINSIEANRYQPSKETLMALANALVGSDKNELFLLGGFAPEYSLEKNDDDVHPKSLGVLLREIRGSKSLREVAVLTGISHNYLNIIEKGVDPRTGSHVKPSPETIRRISEAYNIPYFDIMEKTGYIEYNDIQELVFDDQENFGLYFSKLREESGYRSQRELADKSGVSHSTINRIETGSHRPTPDTLKNLAPFINSVEYKDLMIRAGYIDFVNCDYDVQPDSIQVKFKMLSPNRQKLIMDLINEFLYQEDQIRAE